MTKVVPLPGSERTSSAPLRSSTTVRTTSSPTPRPELRVTSPAVENPGANITWSSAGPLAVESSGSRPRWTAAARRASSSTPRPSSETSMTTVEPAARAATVTVARPGLPAACRAADGSQPWSIALVTRWRSESATASRTRESSSTSWPESTSCTSVASAALPAISRTSWGKPADHPAERHHGQPHRAVADGCDPGLGVVGEGQQVTHRCALLVADRHHGVQAGQHRPRAAPRRRAPRAGPGRCGPARRRERPARGRAGRSGGPRARPRRPRRGGRAPGGSGRGSSPRSAAGRRSSSSAASASASSRGTATGSSPAAALSRAATTSASSSGPTGRAAPGSDRLMLSAATRSTSTRSLRTVSRPSLQGAEQVLGRGGRPRRRRPARASARNP